MSEPVLLKETRNGVCLLTLNRPQALNSWNAELRAELKSAFAELRDDADVRCLVITGAGRAFCAGGDVKEMVPGRTPTAIRDRLRGFLADVVEPLVETEKPVIAAVNGLAVGAGMGFALAADVLLASESAYFSAPFVNLGLVPDAGSAFLLTRAVGVQRAKRICFAGQKISAGEALSLGLVSEVYPPERLLDAALALARTYAALPPTALRLTKSLINRTGSGKLAEMNDFEALYMGIAASDSDHAEALRAMAERRPPVFADARKDGTGN